MIPSRIAPALGLWFALVFPSLFAAQKFLGWTGMGAYAALAALAVWWWFTSTPGTVSHSRSDFWLALGTLIVVTTIFLFVYPRVNSHLPGVGSDDDDANNAGAWALIAGHSPYVERTYLGNVLHQLPGAFVIALPFVVLGTSALQNIFWIAAFFVAVFVETGNSRATLRLAWLLLIFSPTVLHQVVTGTGHAANTIYVLLGLWWLLRTSRTDLAAVAWGIALASRANFLLLLPIAFGALQQRRGTRTAIRVTALTLITVIGITLPFYLRDPTDFGPLEASDRLLRFNALVPYAGEAILVLTGAMALFRARTATTMVATFGNCALVQAVAPIAGAILGTLQRGTPDLSYATYGSFFSWFAVVACTVPEMYQYGHRTSFSD